MGYFDIVIVIAIIVIVIITYEISEPLHLHGDSIGGEVFDQWNHGTHQHPTSYPYTVTYPFGDASLTESDTHG